MRAIQEEQKRETTRQLVEQMKSILTNQAALTAQFKIDCQTRLNNNTNKIAKLARSYKEKLTDFNAGMMNDILNGTKDHENFYSNFNVFIATNATALQLAPEKVMERLSNQVAKIETDRKTYVHLLDEEDNTISNAPKGGFLFFK